jgi:hypothetical protein
MFQGAVRAVEEVVRRIVANVSQPPDSGQKNPLQSAF